MITCTLFILYCNYLMHTQHVIELKNLGADELINIILN